MFRLLNNSRRLRGNLSSAGKIDFSTLGEKVNFVPQYRTTEKSLLKLNTHRQVTFVVINYLPNKFVPFDILDPAGHARAGPSEYVHQDPGDSQPAEPQVPPRPIRAGGRRHHRLPQRQVRSKVTAGQAPLQDRRGQGCLLRARLCNRHQGTYIQFFVIIRA